ncbi:beta family protein [Desulfomicrobium salsuginis]
MDFNHNHYVPCLRWKQGEYMAIAKLSASTRERITPLIEVPEIGFDFEEQAEKKSLDDHIAPFGKRVKAKWGRPCFVDLIHLPAGKLLANGIHPVIQVFEDLRNLGCAATPVTGVSRDPSYQRAISHVVSVDNLGVCIRISVGEAAKSTLAAMLDRLLEQLRVKQNKCHLVLDLGSPKNFEPIDGFTKLACAILSRLPYQDEWKTITVTGSSFPETMAEVRRSPAQIPRWEWLLYKGIVAKLGEKGARVPTFGDYGVSHTDIAQVDMRLVKPSATIRYTIDDAWLILKGVNVRDHGFEQYRSLCNDLINSPYFRDPEFSMGDEYIYHCAIGKVKTGNLSTWRKVGTNQHMEKVVHDVANLFGL